MTAPVAPMPAPTFSAVQPTGIAPTAFEPTGSIYNGRQSENWFGRGRNFQVGDIITVLLDERTQAARSTNTRVERNAETPIPTGLDLGRIKGIVPGLNLSTPKMSSEGTGDAAQQASLTGSLAVSVVEVMPNGNLVVRGEKQLSLSEGSEVIQVSGVIRPQDVSPNNTVLSRRLAHSQIAYRGSGELAAAAQPGWGMRAISRLWPF
jgi:flagellar L-ring protein precursor FlgH